jgi:hypothetical protein
MMEPPLTITLDQLAALHRKIEGVDKRLVVLDTSRGHPFNPDDPRPIWDQGK